MSVFKALQDVTYFPDGPGSKKVAKEGELITLTDELDYIVGSQINPEHVERVDLEAVVKRGGRKAADKE